VWSIMGILTGYFGLFDFGLARSFDKFFAEYHTKQDEEKFNIVFNVGFIFYFLFSILIMGLVLLFYEPLLDLLGLSSERVGQAIYEEGVFVVIGASVIFGWGMASSAFGMMMIGLQRMDVLNKIGISMSVVGIIGTIIVLENGYGLRGLIVSGGVTVVISSIVTIFAAYALVPSLKFNPFLAEWQMFRTMFRFGGQLQVAKLANLLAFQLNSLLISGFLHVRLVTAYSYSSSLIGSLRNVILMLPSAVIPATSELEARDEQERSLELYERGTRYLVLIGTPLCLFSAIGAPLLVLAWLGTSYELGVEMTWLIQILALGYYANLSTGVATGIAVGMGKPEFEMKFGVMLAITSLVLSVGLIKWIGFYGPAIASTLSLTVCALYFYKLFHTHLKQPLWPFLTRIYRMPILMSIIAGLVTYAIQWTLIDWIAPTSRLMTLAVVGFEGLVFLLIYTLLILRTPYLDAYDRSLFNRYLAKFKRG
jgi:O-antigen/teichoic acid export membrane protein